jgi:mannosyltransferase
MADLRARSPIQLIAALNNSFTKILEPQPHQDVRGFWLYAAAIIGLGALLRFWDLNGASLWMDEAATLGFARLPLHVIAFNNIDNHPPLSYIIQHVWQLLVPDSAYARVPAAAIGTTTLIVIILMLRDIVGQRAAIFCGLLFAVSTSHVYFSQEARMYASLVLGLCLAIWGSLGHARAGGEGGYIYWALYIVGGSIAIYSQILALVGMGLIAAAECGSALSTKGRLAYLRSWFLRNALLGILALPWLLSIPSATETFSGIFADHGFRELSWMFGNVSGFPGLGGIGPVVKLFELSLYIACAGGIAAAWSDGRRALSLTLGALVVVYPLSVFAIDFLRPIISNRVLLPVVIGITVATGYFLSRISPRRIGASAIGILGLTGLFSTAFELRHHVKPEDYRAAFAIADAEGFSVAPVITCIDGGAAAAYETDVAARILYYRNGETMLYPGPEYWQASSQSMKVFRASSATELDTYLGGGLLFKGGLAEALAGDNMAGFDSVKEVPVSGISADFVIFETASTQLNLYVRRDD